MSPNRRILLNIIATYGRSLYGLVLGLFCGRWALMALGEVDYGLMGVVGGLTVFISILNNIFASANSRFYAYAIGQARNDNGTGSGLEECRRWFSLAVVIHTVMPTILMVVGYPLGVYAVRHFLVIPPDRLEACIWVFRFVCISCFLGMASVPFNAMYMAKQYIAELTVYSFATATLNACFLYYAVTHPGDWLTRFALWTCFLAVVPSLLIATRALVSFPECKFVKKYCLDRTRFKQIVSFAGWSSFGSLGMVFRSQGIAIVINKFFGPSVNAAMGIAGSIDRHAQSLAGAMQGAFVPVITSEIGAGNLEHARKLVYRFCKFGTALTLFFIIPLSIELHEIIRIWLKHPPDFTIGLCYFMLAMSFIDKTTFGYGVAVRAQGDIKWYQIVLGTCNMLAIPLACLFVWIGGNVYAVGWGMFVSWSALVFGRLYFAKAAIGTAIGQWLSGVMKPIAIALGAGILFGIIPSILMEPSLGRIGLSTLLAESGFLPVLWVLGFDTEEKHYVVNQIRRSLRHG